MGLFTRSRVPAPETATAHLPTRQTRATYLSGDPAFAEMLGLSGQSDAGVSVTESSSLSLAAVYGAVRLIAGTIATLPLKSYRDSGDVRTRIPTFLDNPAGPDGLTAFEWVELVLVYLLLHGNAFLWHIYNGAGSIVGLQPIHPSAVQVKPVQSADERARYFPFNKYFHVSTVDGGGRDFSPLDLTHIQGMGTDGLRGLSIISTMRNAIGTGLAGDQAAARTFSNGFLLGGLVTTAEDVTMEEAQAIKADFTARTRGTTNAGDIAFVNKVLEFKPWTMSAEDAQFLESRKFQVEDIARIFGLMPIHLAQTEKQTSWGSGIQEQNLGLSRYTLMPWTSRIEQRLSRLLPRPQFCEFDYKGLLQGTPKQEVELLAFQVEKGLLTLDEVRAIMNLPPLEAPSATPTEVPA